MNARILVAQMGALLTGALLHQAFVASAPAFQAPTGLSVVVSAREAERIDDAVQTLADSPDTFVAALAPRLPALASALGGPRADEVIYALGPLSASEAEAIDLPGYLAEFSDPQGTIRLQRRITWVDRDPTVFTYTVAGFVEMLASIARGPLVQIPAVQRQQLLLLGRMALDLNQQAGGVIPDREVFAAMAAGFRDKTGGRRLVRTARAMADVGGTYDLVPPARLEAFSGLMETVLFVPPSSPAARTINVSYDGTEFTTTEDYLLWTLLRFFSGAPSDDWAMRSDAKRRSALGREMLDYVQSQVETHAVRKGLAAIAATTGGDVNLGRYRADGLAVAFLRRAPGVRTQASAVREFVEVSVRVNGVAKLKQWLERRLAERIAK